MVGPTMHYVMIGPDIRCTKMDSKKLEKNRAGQTAHTVIIDTSLHLSLMWERALQDLIRANKRDEAQFIAQAVNEIRQEINMELKAGAVLKLTYVRR